MQIIGKYIDQPALINTIRKTAPKALIAGATFIGIKDVLKQPEEKRKNSAIKNFFVLSFTVASALISTKGLKIAGKQIVQGIEHECHHHHDDIDKLKTIIKEKITGGKQEELLKIIEEKLEKQKILNVKDIRTLNNELEKVAPKEKLLNMLIPDPHEHSLKHSFEEIAQLSYIGLVPVIGGVLGGIFGDKFSGEKWREKLPDKVKEGAFQYLANIFLCNLGALAGLIIARKKSKPVKMAAALSGVIITGLIAGSQIANYIGKKFINPIFDKKEKYEPGKTLIEEIKYLNNERRPELIDLSLHIDDIASVGFLAGLKWIGPILPLLYSISAYRAGIGYRNHPHQHHNDHNFNHHHQTLKEEKPSFCYNLDKNIFGNFK